MVRSSVPKIDLDDVFTTKEEISQNIKKELEESMGSFGYEILATPITDIDPDAQVGTRDAIACSHARARASAFRFHEHAFLLETGKTCYERDQQDEEAARSC